MKKILVASILGIVATVATVNKAQAQGFVYFGNYTGGGATAPVTYSGTASGGFVNGETIGGPGFTAELLYAIGGGSTYADTGITTTFIANAGDSVANGGGLFGSFANQVTIPGYSSGPVDFKVQVFNGASYNAATIRGESGVVSLSILATAANQLPTAGLMADNGNATAPLTAFTVSQVPEPTVFALAGLGAAALMVVRRKK